MSRYHIPHDNSLDSITLPIGMNLMNGPLQMMRITLPYAPSIEFGGPELSPDWVDGAAQNVVHTEAEAREVAERFKPDNWPKGGLTRPSMNARYDQYTENNDD